MKYRSDIDGLRALAVLPVVFFHVGLSSFSGGYIGVDVFFVISGFLITSIIIHKVDAGEFSFSDFYERRARRILPALFFYFVLASILAIVVYPPHMLKDFGQSLVANAFFLSNIFFYIETDYFNDFSETAPLLHTWSLSVEEQYYLIVPWLLVILIKYAPKFCFLVIFFLAFASLAYSEYMLSFDKPYSFYFLTTRFWELGVGSLLAFAMRRDLFAVVPDRLAGFLSVIGVTAILVASFLFHSQMRFPGLSALIPVLGAAAVIAFSRPSTLCFKLLSLRPIVGVGLISYSLYLSHHIFFSITRVSSFNFDEPLVLVAVMTISFIMAIFSWRYVEGPVRRVKMPSGYLFLACFLGLMFFALLGYVIHHTDGLKKLKFLLLNDKDLKIVLDYPSIFKEREAIWQDILKYQDTPFDNGTSKRKVLILGDSKSEDFFVATQFSDFENDEFRRMRLDDLCMSDTVSSLEPDCQDELDGVLSSSLYKNSEAVVLSATWQYVSNKDVVKFVEKLSRDNKIIYLVSTANFNDVSSLSYVIAKKSMSVREERKFIFSNIRWDWRRQYQMLKTELHKTQNDVLFLDKINVFCNIKVRTCRLRDGAEWYIYDSGHLTVRGASEFSQRMKRMGWFK